MMCGAISLVQRLWTVAVAWLMTMADKPQPAPSPPDKVQPLPATVFISEKRGGDGASDSTK